ncbi:hypothetical protein C3F09_10790 [candidate division GN15 bacterium]|uniref:histidine kinase n=1 Tax=candidate division GN15 bacterium TaxID=2072418 RepID=A0A855X429_9BACT|nr:MAG: hypothetical protein C3F09_10790 [candidate division GN15 bacterium]
MNDRVAIGPREDVNDANSYGRKVLALEALSSLADQFARRPELQNLIDALTLTVSGQFGVTSAYIITRDSDSISQLPVTSATGRFRRDVSVYELDQVALDLPVLLADPRPRRLDDPILQKLDSPILTTWQQLGAHLVAPLVLGEKIIGIMLLGPRINQAPFAERDLELLQTLIATITPLIANSFLYSEKAHLSERYRLILDSVHQAIFVFNSQDFLRLANRTAVELIASLTDVGVESGPVGLPLKAVFPDAVFPGWVERLQSARQENESRPLSTMVATPSAGRRIFSVRIGSLAGLAAVEDETVVTLQDITEQQDNERRMFELEKFAEQGVMASSISHELNNHLGVLLGGVELATFNLSRGNQEKVAQTLAKLKDGVERMGRFTAGLTDFARVNAATQPGRINDVVTDVLSFAMAQKRFSRINVKTMLTQKVPAILMDRDQIAQVVINLLNNAADAITETGRSDGIIIVSTTASGSEVILSVSDNGRGMTTETRDKLFKTHFTTKPKGHGYGLMTCARILEHHSANIAINSQVGFGTTFELRFKTASEAPGN